MGRELRRKDAKRSGKNVKEVQKQNQDKPITTKNFIIIMIALIVLLILTYIFTGIFATKDIKWFSKNNNEEEETTNEIRNRILASDTLKQLDDEYYVYYYDSTKEASDITRIVDNLDGTIYRVDLHDDFNANFVGEPSGVVDSIDNLKVSDPTVIKVSLGKIIAFYNGEEIKTSL